MPRRNGQKRRPRAPLVVTIHGTVTEDATEFVSKSGNTLTRCSMRLPTERVEGEDDAMMKWGILGYGDALEDVGSLRKGDIATVTGTGSLQRWQPKEGDEQLQGSVFARDVTLVRSIDQPDQDDIPF